VNSQSKKGNSVEDAVSLEVKRTSESSYFRETEFLCKKTAFLQIYGIKNELFGSVANYFGETQVLCRKKTIFLQMQHQKCVSRYFLHQYALFFNR